MVRKQDLSTIAIFIAWMLIASLVLLLMLNPDKGITTAITAVAVFAALSGADRFKLI